MRNRLRKSYEAKDHDTSGVVRIGRRVLFKPCLGLFNQDKLIPIRYLPLELELEVVSHGVDATMRSDDYVDEWSISDVQLKCDLLTLDSSLDNEYPSLMLSGKYLPISFSSWNHTAQQTVGGAYFPLVLAEVSQDSKPYFAQFHNSTTTSNLKEANNLYHPMALSISIR
eukprot:1996226-Heterocapsa_arctica.AAC.1